MRVGMCRSWWVSWVYDCAWVMKRVSVIDGGSVMVGGCEGGYV